VSNLEILKFVESGLMRARSIADHAAGRADDGFLLYLIDMAIFEAKSEARSRASDRNPSAARTQFFDYDSGNH